MVFQDSSNIFANSSQFCQRFSAERNTSEHGRQTSSIISIASCFSIVKRFRHLLKKGRLPMKSRERDPLLFNSTVVKAVAEDKETQLQLSL